MSAANITQERAARRFHQVAVLERRLQKIISDVVQCREHLKELKEQQEALVDRMRIAARDEGELPLFDLDGDGDEGN